MTSLIDLEDRLDVELPPVRLSGRPTASLVEAGRRWSDEVWAAATAAGPIALNPRVIAKGLEIARRPVFVTGVHRSGTTLVRDLLDGHRALAVLPSEGTFFTNLGRRFEGLPRDARIAFFGGVWLRRLANPMNQAPYWLLGRSQNGRSPYIAFAQALMAWAPVVEARMGGVASSWPLAAVALAYAHSTGGFAADSPLERWVEKTPANERFLDRLWAEFPDAKIVQVIRDPVAVYASHKRLEEQATGSFPSAWRTLRALSRTYEIAARQARDGDVDRFFMIRYEELIERPQDVTARLAAFLEIPMSATLLQPTAAGMLSAANSSFAIDPVRGRIVPSAPTASDHGLTSADREWVAAAAGDAAVTLGYRVASLTPWRARLLRLAAYVRP